MMQEQVAQIPEVVWQFGENCASLWEERERAARSRVYRSTFTDLCALDSRIDAQLDGLRVSGVEGWKVATEALELQGGGEVFTASVLAFEYPEAPKADPIDRLLDSISKPRLAAHPMSMALDWIAPQQTHSALKRLSAKRLPLARAVTMMAQAARGIDCAPHLIAALDEGDTFVVHAACWAAVRLGAKSAEQSLSVWLQSEDLETRLIAARATLLLGGHGASRVLEELAATSSPAAEAAATALFHSCPPTRALSLHRDLFGGLYSRPSISAAGAAGIPELVPFLLECLDYPPLSRPAGEAIGEVTGVDLSKAGLSARKAERCGPSEHPEDADIEIDQDEGLTWPEAEAVRSWWGSHSADFVPMTKHLAGQVVRSDMLREYIVRDGLQRRRATAAEMLALSGRPLFDVCAPAFRQTERLAGDDLCR